MNFTLLAAIIALMAIFYILNMVSNKKRTKNIENKAHQAGFDYISKSVIPSKYRKLRFKALKHEGLQTKAKNMIHDEFERFKILIFEYGKMPNQAFFIIEFTNKILPDFNLYPNKLGKKLNLSIFRYKKINLTSKNLVRQDQFGERFVLYGEDESELNNLFGTDLVSYLLTTDNLSFECRNSTLLFYRDGATLDVDNISKAIPLAKEVADSFLK